MTERDGSYSDEVVRITWTARPAVLAIAGEIDEFAHPAVMSALSDLAEEHHEIRVSLAGLASCDLEGLRAVVSVARPGERDSRRNRAGRRRHAPDSGWCCRVKSRTRCLAAARRSAAAVRRTQEFLRAAATLAGPGCLVRA